MRAEDILKDSANEANFDGVSVRKGTIGAFLHNAKAWSDAGTGAEARAIAQKDIRDAASALVAIGLFDVMEIRDPALRAFVDQLR